jgi:hypothetical protein
MLSEKEKRFIITWEQERQRRAGFADKLLSGLPMALIFSLPILLLVFVVYFCFPDWYMKISGTSQGTFMTVVIAVLISTFFFSYFRMHYKWEMNEQLYHELKRRDKSTANSKQLPE